MTSGAGSSAGGSVASGGTLGGAGTATGGSSAAGSAGSAGTMASSGGSAGTSAVGGSPSDAGSPGLGGGTPVGFGDRTDADYQACTDTWIIEYAPTQNRGTNGSIMLTGEAGKRQVGLVYFDISALVAGTTVTGAELQLRTNADEYTDGEINVYQMLESWVDLEATWNERTTGVAWTTLGAGVGSRSDVALATFAAAVDFTIYHVPLPATLIQGWVDDPASNFGLALVHTGIDIGQFYAGSSGTESNRPLLVVTVL